MKKLITGVLVIIMVCASSPVFAKIYNSFDSCDKFRAGDVIRMENSLAFPSYIYELEIKQVTKKEGSIAVRGRRVLTDKATGEVSVSEDYTQIVRAQKMDMKVVVNIDKPSGNSRVGRTDGSGQNKPNNTVPSDNNAGNPEENSDLSGGDGELFQLMGKKHNRDVLISPIRGLNVTKDKTQVWETPESNNFIIIYIVIGIIILLSLAFIVMQNKHRLKKFKRVTLVILLFISIAINVPSTHAITLYEQNFESLPYKKDYLTYGRTYERRMSSHEQQSGSYVKSWSKQVSTQTYSQPLIEGNFVYHYADRKIYKIDSAAYNNIKETGFFAENSGRPAVGNMTICGNYIFVGDRKLNMHVIDKDTMECIGGYSILGPNSDYNTGLLNEINDNYGTKGIVSAPYVKEINSKYEVYFGTSVGLFVKLVVDPDIGVIDNACILNNTYQFYGEPGHSSYNMNGSSICIVSSPMCVAKYGSFNYSDYLYIGTPYSGGESDFYSGEGYVCLYKLEGNILDVREVIEGGVETTMAYDGTKLVFADRNGNAHSITVADNGSLGLHTDAEITGTSSKPPVIGCPSVFRAGSQRALAVFSVTRDCRFVIVESTHSSSTVMNDDIVVASCNDSYFGGITNSPHILHMGENVYLLYADKNKIRAKDITCCLADGGDFSDANIFKKDDGSKVSEIAVCDSDKYLTSDITVARAKIFVSDSGGNLHCLKFETGQGDFEILNRDVKLYRRSKPQGGVPGNWEEMSDDPDANQVIEIGSDYVYQLKANISSTFVSDVDNVKVTLRAYQKNDDGIPSPYKFEIIEAGEKKSVEAVEYYLNIPPGETLFETEELKFGMDFSGDKVVFEIEVNPDGVPNRPAETNLHNNIAELEWRVWRIDLNLYIDDIDVRIGNYIPLAVGMPQVPVVIYGIARNASKRLDVQQVPITLTIRHDNVPLLSQTTEVNIKHKCIGYTGPDDPEYSGMQYFWFEVPQNVFTEGELYDIKIEINPIRSDGTRKYVEIDEDHIPGSPNYNEIYNDNVVNFTGIEAIDRDKLGTYEDVWVNDGAVHTMTGKLTDYEMYREDYDYRPLDRPWGDEVINAKSGYGIDLRSKYTVKHWSSNGGDWPAMVVNSLKPRCYIVKPKAVSDSCASISLDRKTSIGDDSILLKNLKDLAPGEIAENCIEILYKQGQTIFDPPEYAHDYEMESNEKMIADDDTQSLQETLDVFGMNNGNLGRNGDEMNYVCALKKSEWSPHENRRIYPHSDTPDNEENEAYTILISTTFEAQITLADGTEHPCKIRTTNLYYVLQIGGVMHNDDASHLLQ